MTKLDELIKEYCPNGVEYRKIGELAKLSVMSNDSITNLDRILDEVLKLYILSCQTSKEAFFDKNKSISQGGI